MACCGAPRCGGVAAPTQPSQVRCTAGWPVRWRLLEKPTRRAALPTLGSSTHPVVPDAPRREVALQETGGVQLVGIWVFAAGGHPQLTKV